MKSREMEGKTGGLVLLATMAMLLGSPLLAAGQNLPQPIAAGEEDSLASSDDELVSPLTVGARAAATTAKQPKAAAIQGLQRLNSSTSGGWKADFGRDGSTRMLHGSLSRQYTGGGESTARAFLSDTRDIFGLSGDLTDLATVRVDSTPERDHVRFQQTFNGVPVANAQVIVHSNRSNQVTMVQSGFIDDLQPANSLVLAESAARGIAMDDLRKTRESDIFLSEPKSEKQIILMNGKHLYTWKISIPSRKPYGLWVYQIDGESGAILYKQNEILSVVSGKGNVFKTNGDYLMGKVSSAPLKNMYKQGTSDDGYLYGTFANVFSYDANYSDPWSSTYKFLFNPIAQPNQFHATQAYYAIDTVHDWWLKNVVKKYLGTVDNSNPFTWSTPIHANVLTDPNNEPMCNAYYSPGMADHNYAPGMVFGNENNCAPGSADLVLDWDVVRHEYTHAMMDWFGFNGQFSSPLHYYGRAMGEGNADWYAYIIHPKDSRMATVAWEWSSEGYLRNLLNTRMYPRDVNLPQWGLPEEHYTGEIWGGYLYDLYQTLGTKALPYLLASYFYFDPSDGMMDGYPDFYDALRAQFNAELDLTGKYTNSMKAWGLLASRGISGYLEPPYSHPSNYFRTGLAESDDRWGRSFSFPSTVSVTTKGNMLKSGDRHEYLVRSMNPAMKLTASVKAAKSGFNAPSMELYDRNGTKLAGSPSTTGTATALSYTLATGDLYILKVSGNTSTPGRGYYDLKITVK
jgi:Zn-dependent metalloprotease